MRDEQCERLLSALRDFREEHEVSPTLRELAKLCGFSYPTAFRVVRLLCAKGKIRHIPGRCRTMRPT